MYSLYLWMCISNAPLNGLPRKGVSDKPMRFDSYIREIVSKLSNPMGLLDNDFDEAYLHMFKSLQQWYLKGKDYYICKALSW